MVALDSLKVTFPREVVTDFRQRAFNRSERTFRREMERVEVSEVMDERVGKKICGLNTVHIGRDTATIEVSGKILGGLYPHGINLNTVDRLVDGINATGILSVDGPRFLDSAKVLKCDACANLPVSDASLSLDVLRVVALNERYIVTPYEGEGIVIQSRANSNKTRLIFYVKEREMRSKKNAVWVKSGQLDPDQFSGILRAETNIRTHKGIRELFAVDEQRLLLDVLSSEQNPLLTVFELVTDNNLVRDEAERFYRLLREPGGFAHVVKMRGLLSVFEDCHWEWLLVKAYLKSTYRGRSKPTVMLRRTKAEFDRMNRGRQAEGVDVGGGLDEIRTLLQRAA